MWELYLLLERCCELRVRTTPAPGEMLRFALEVGWIKRPDEVWNPGFCLEHLAKWLNVGSFYHLMATEICTSQDYKAEKKRIEFSSQ